ncbi:MAG TPA: hypothetical protein VEL06_03710, partial [Haliangiales bacterium]|nr:hypothetical protein [Haliangiales bacterium]
EAEAFVMSGHVIWNPNGQTTQKEQRPKRALFAFGMPLPMNARHRSRAATHEPYKALGQIRVAYAT